MAYIVLALGVLMSLVGLGAMVTGYPVIEIERGWAMVIAGAVLLSGGLVTAALGIVVRQLVGLRGSLQLPAFASQAPSRAEAPDIPSQAMSIPVVPAPPAMQAPATRTSIGVMPAFAVAAPVAAAATFAAGQAHEPGAAHDQAPPPPVAEPEPEPAEAYEAPDPRYEHTSEETSATAHEPEETHEAFEPKAAAHEAPHHAEPEPTPPQEQGQPLHSEAWLDQAFQAFDYEMTGGHPAAAHPEPEAPEAVHGAPAEPEALPPEHLAESAPEAVPHDEAPSALAQEEAHEELHADTSADAHEDPEPVAAAAPATAHEAPSNLAVIGRYDSDGTSYVMYSDGSIEAQSEAGVYRFGSMAELKAFIEG